MHLFENNYFFFVQRGEKGNPRIAYTYKHTFQQTAHSLQTKEKKKKGTTHGPWAMFKKYHSGGGVWCAWSGCAGRIDLILGCANNERERARCAVESKCERPTHGHGPWGLFAVSTIYLTLHCSHSRHLMLDTGKYFSIIFCTEHRLNCTSLLRYFL